MKRGDRNHRAQEEMVGFALIIILVSVILLVFLGFFLSNQKAQIVKSYEAESFVIASLQYSTECRDYYGYLSVKNLIFMCNSGTPCKDGENSCEILNSTLNGILNQSWKVGKESPIQGYELNITSNTGNVFSAFEGNITRNSEGTLQPFTKAGASVNVLFNVFY